MPIDLNTVAKALNAIDLDDLLESFDRVKEMGFIMINQGEEDHPLNQAMDRIFTNTPFMDAMQGKADRLGMPLEEVLFTFLHGLLVGLITPVPMEVANEAAES